MYVFQIYVGVTRPDDWTCENIYPRSTSRFYGTLLCHVDIHSCEVVANLKVMPSLLAYKDG